MNVSSKFYTKHGESKINACVDAKFTSYQHSITVLMLHPSDL